MNFGYLENLKWGLVVLVCAGFLYWGWSVRNRRLGRLISLKMKDILLRGVSRPLLIMSKALWLLAILFVFVSLLGPRWGFKWEEVHRKGIDIYIAIDTSRSMMAQDVLPDRLERAKLEVRDLISHLHGDRIGLIAFAGKAFIKCPLTYDAPALQLFLNDIRIEDMPVGGTSLASAINLALRRFSSESQKEKLLVILSDGEDHDEETEKALKKAVEAGVTIYTIGIGTVEGTPILLQKEGDKKYVKDNSGNIVVSSLNMSSLNRISTQTGGISALSSKGTDLQLVNIYVRKLQELEKTEFDRKKIKRFYERYYYFAAAALFLLTLSVLIMGGRRK